MSAGMWIPYLCRQVELGLITREEADKTIERMIEIDNMPEKIVSEETLDKFNNIGCTSFQLTKEELKNILDEKLKNLCFKR